jgi:Amidohydrolase
VVFFHPAELPGPTVPGVAPWAADFLLDTTRAAYLLVRNGIRSKYPNIRFILSHAGGFVPYASHRMAVAILADTGRSPADSLDDFSSFYFDTALSSSAAALPTLLAFAKPGHVTFGSDWPFAPVAAGRAFRGRTRDLSRSGQRRARRHRPHQRAHVVPATRHRAGTGAGVADRRRSPCCKSHGDARGRSAHQHQLTAAESSTNVPYRSKNRQSFER